MERLVTLCEAFADSTRLRILALLDGCEELCVCEIVEALDIPQYNVSRHLGVLKKAGLVVDRRQGTWMHYSISPQLSSEERLLLSALRVCLDKDPTSEEDLQRLEEIARPRIAGEVVKCAD